LLLQRLVQLIKSDRKLNKMKVIEEVQEVATE